MNTNQGFVKVGFRMGSAIRLFCVMIWLTLPAPSLAQVTTNITSSGLGTTVNQADNVHTITGGTRPGNGPNLFHSFGNFSVGSGDIANFFNDSGLATKNILSRVTGGNVSNIFGTIQTTNFGNANLFLLNPAGVIFGPNASLDIGGSFHVGTADFIKMSDGAKFFADTAQPSVLSVASPMAFGFLGPNPAGLGITVDGSILQVQDGKTLSLVGGNITINGGTLTAPNGRIQLASVASEGEVQLFNSQGAPNLKLTNVTALGDIQLSDDWFPDPNETVLIRGTLLGTIFDGHIVLLDPDGNSVPLFGPFFEITSDQGMIEGGNLYLTFSRFDLYANEFAFITDPSGVGITNVISRVVGGEQSFVDGTIFPDIFGSSFYYLNPHGIVFGRGSAENGFGSFFLLGGSIHVSTADYLKFADGSKFFSSLTDANGQPNVDMFTMADPSAFGFQSPSPSAIDILGSAFSIIDFDQLNIAVVGGPVTVAGGAIDAPSGQVQLVGVGSTTGAVGPVEVVMNAPGTSPSVAVESVPHFAPIQVLNSFVGTNDSNGVGSGTVVIRGGAITVDNSKLHSFVTTGNGISAPLGIDLQADSVMVKNGSEIFTGSFADANSGGLSISAQVATIENSAIESQTRGQGVGGPIVVDVGNLTMMHGATIVSSTNTPSPAADITIQADDHFLLSGDLEIADRSLVRNASLASTGASGKIEIEAGSLTIEGSAQILGESRQAPQGGNIFVTVHNDLSIAGKGVFENSSSGIQIFSAATGNSLPGDITVSAGSISITNDGLIRSGNIQTGQGGNVSVTATNSMVLASGGGISSIASKNDVGVLTISAGNLTVNGGFIRASTEDVAKGGDINVSAGSAQLNNAAEISAKSTGTGDAGNITIDAGSSFVATNSKVTTEASQADGGNITIMATDLIHLTNTEVSSSVGSPTITTTEGGNIIIDPTFIILQNSQIIAQAFAGIGGNITITAGALFIDPASVISASSQLGVNGTVNIQAPINELSGTLSPLSSAFQQSAALVAARCAAQLGGRLSTFVLAGRDGIPAEPGGLLPSPLLAAGLPTVPSAAYTGPDVDGVSVRLAHLGIQQEGLRLSGGWQLSRTAQEALALGCAG